MTGPMPPNVGGMATVLFDLGESKLAEKVELSFFNTAKTTREGRSLFEALSSKFHLWADWIKLLSAKPRTIAHIHTCSGFTFFLDGVLICLARLCSASVIVHVHGGMFDQFLDGLNGILSALVRWLFRRCDVIIVLSGSWQQALEKRIGKQYFFVLANGVPILDNRVVKPAAGNTVNLLFLGNLTENKGIFDLIDVMRNLDNVVLHVVGGEGETGIFDKINNRIKQFQINDKIKLHGIQRGPDKQRLLQNADIFVLPSHAEGLPVSMLEAMANGLPIVASTVGAIPTVITDGMEGFLFQAGNHTQLLTALHRLVADSELRITMGEAARNRCRSEFGIDSTVDKLLVLYQQLSQTNNSMV